MNRQIYEEACDWFVRMRDARGEDNNAAAQRALMSWLQRSPDHVSAYLDIAAIWRETGSVQVDSQVDLAQRIAEARADGDIAELHPANLSGKARFAGGTLRRFAVAAAMLIAIGAVYLFISLKAGAPQYSTQLAELRSIRLADGSTVEFNSRSRIKVQFGKIARRIELVQGQALFRVAKDPARPFIVTASGASVRAMGTIFDVYRREADAIVTVLEGSVAVLSGPESATATPVLLSAGKQMVVERGGMIRPKPVDVTAATAWTRRQLVFEFTPLEEAAEEFNRYNARKLIVEGEQLRSFKISAIFESTDAAALVKFLRDTPGVRVVETDQAISILPKDGKTN